VGPDNGLFSLVLKTGRSREIREIKNPDFFLPDPHPTFHGRDVFAPVAAHLSSGDRFDLLGPVIEDPVMLPIPSVDRTRDGIQGEVIYIDRFGNLISNIEARLLSRPVDTVQVGERKIKGVKRFFSEVPEGSPLALINSFGFLEIAVNLGNASLALGIQRGARVTVRWA
ncbi:MAG TPA: SAM-dependent chlorinase/fluorinase, partial [Desulfomonilaceae bacterium]|nr:SAM-dependent chlorinase/fluorinase [Desulfomonilaceae bacterium]